MMKDFKKTFLLLWWFSFSLAISAQQQRTEFQLTDNWRFTRADNPDFSEELYDANDWQIVSVPHDWAIEGPFDKEIDKQVVAIEQNGEKIPSEKTGRSGSLPWIGTGWYRTEFKVPASPERILVHFDGAMSEPQVYVNGKKAGEWKYGYSSFYLDITPYVYGSGKTNVLAVRLQNMEQSSRWYPGGGIYRPVTIISTGKTAIDMWGVNAVTESIDVVDNSAIVNVSAKVVCENSDNLIARFILEGNGHKYQADSRVMSDKIGRAVIDVEDAGFWTPETPTLYNLTVELLDKGNNGRLTLLDRKVERIGIRTVEVNREKGFCLNGVQRKFKGVCLHHDLGMLGTAVNKAALARQIKLLKSMGCDAIRVSHNMPSQWQMELCDSLGMMVMPESFDEWIYAKCKNGYHRFFDDWVEKDLTNLVLVNRLHPSVVMWSIGNEIPEQGSSNGALLTRRLQDIVHRLDKTRPVTAGMDRIDNAISTGFAQILDVPGMNYRTHKYKDAYKKLGHGFLLGSETASTVSSRGVYKFPVVEGKNKTYDDGQCSSYDLEACSWSNIPEYDWELQDDMPWVIGEFVWTGFDYLGEPTPYDGYWPSRSSYFGIFDLAGLPKDRYYLYRSRWNTENATIHLLPHWTWNGREGEVTPVFCYTNYPTAELFVNGKSQGRISKNKQELMNRYRLRWDDVKYEPGELKVVVYDEVGKEAGSRVVRTAGKPAIIQLVPDKGVANSKSSLSDMTPVDNPAFFSTNEPVVADGKDLVFVSVRILDKDGNLCPDADNQLSFKVSGAGRFKGVCNGDATSLESFVKPIMKAFHGELVVAIQTKSEPGQIRLIVSGKGLKSQTLTISTVKSANSSLEGKVINVIGDSYVANHRAPRYEAWHSKVARKHGMIYNNYGRNGGCVAFDRTKDGFGPSLMVRHKDMAKNADAILIVAGHNDAGKVGLSADSLRMFSDSLNALIKSVKKLYPASKLGYVTPWYVDRDGFAPVVDVIKKVCAKHNVPVLDNYREECIIKVRDAEFRKKYFQGANDTAHLNDAGHDLFMRVGEEFLLNMFK